MHLNTSIKLSIYFLLALVSANFTGYAQSPGLIIKSATGAGRAILDPDLNGFASTSASGYTNSDVDTAQTEIRFRVVKPLFYEPTGDLLRGPSGGFSDLVTSVDSSGFYVYSDGTRLLFRLRIGDYISGSKAYSIGIDTDGKFGYSGANADPGYTAPANGKPGNPGFEFEVSFQNNFRVAVYNVDTPGKVVLAYANTPVTDYSQVSVALSYTSGNPDYFVDFYVPFAQLGIHANTPLRLAATTVVAPQSAFGGPSSDIYGYGPYTDVMSAWTQVVTYQTPVTPAGLSTITSILVCTPAPVVNAPAVGSTSITGSWTRLDGSKPNTAKIYLYRNAVLTDSVTATSGSGWTIPLSPAAASGNTFYARAKAATEGNCFRSATVTAIKCIGPVSARPDTTCVSNKGLDGTYPVSGSRIRIYKDVVPGSAGLASFTLLADSGGTTSSNFGSGYTPFVLQDNATKKWKYDGSDGNGNPSSISNGACTGGNTADMPAGITLAITAQEPGKCESMPVFVCPNGTRTAVPVITAPVLYPGSVVSGTTAANAYLRLYVDSTLRSAIYADASGNFSFANAGLSAGSRIELSAQSASSCVSSSVSRTVIQYTTPPVITTDNAGFLTLGATTISGTSTEANNTTVRIYKRSGSTVTLVGTTTVTGNAWALTVPATVANELYIATQQAIGGAVSDSSNLGTVPGASTTSCAVPSASSYPANTASITGTVSPAMTNGKVYLYIDNALADSASGVTSAFTVSTNTTAFNTLYAGAALTFTTKAAGGPEKLDCGASGTATVTCRAVQSPAFTLSPSSIAPGGTTTASVSNAASGLLYTLVGSPDNGKTYGNSVMASGTSVSLSSYTFSNPGTYPLTVRALNLTDGSGCASSATASSLIVASSPLPVVLNYFKGQINALGQAMLGWNVANEAGIAQYEVERSTDGATFRNAGSIFAVQSGKEEVYSYTDPERPQGRVWYRLHIVASTGGSSHSPLVALKADASKTNPVVMPVPFEGSLTIAMDVDEPARVEIRLTDMAAQVRAGQRFMLSAGSYRLLLPGLSQIAPGAYLLDIYKNGVRVLTQAVRKK